METLLRLLIISFSFYVTDSSGLTRDRFQGESKQVKMINKQLEHLIAVSNRQITGMRPTIDGKA